MVLVGVRFNSHDSERDRKGIALLIAIWPVTIVLMTILGAWEFYQKIYNNKVHKMLAKYGSTDIMRCVPQMTVRELEILLFCRRIKAYHLEEKDVDTVQKRIADILFEKQVLEK